MHATSLIASFSLRTRLNILGTPDKRKHMRHYVQRTRALLAQVQRVKARWQKVQEESTLEIEEGLSSDLVTIMAEARWCAKSS